MAGACQSWAMKHAACRWNRRRRKGAWCVWCMVYGVRCTVRLVWTDDVRGPWEEEGVAVWHSGGPDRQGCLAAFGLRFFRDAAAEARREGERRGKIKEEGGRSMVGMEVGRCGDLRTSRLEEDGAHAHGGRSVEFEGTDKYADAKADRPSE